MNARPDYTFLPSNAPSKEGAHSLLAGTTNHISGCISIINDAITGNATVESVMKAKREIETYFPAPARATVFRLLQDEARRSEDLFLRDLVFENLPDPRSVEDILNEEWWPNLPRVLAQSIQMKEKSRSSRELDNFFRWRQRTADTHRGTRLRSLFLTEPLSDKNLYKRLSCLCFALDAVLPGDEDLVALRNMQRALYAKVWPHSTNTQNSAGLIPAVEALLAKARHPRTGDKLADATLTSKRKALNLHHKLLSQAGHSFSFERSALDIFADYAIAQVSLLDGIRAGKPRETTRKNAGWCRISAQSYCLRLTPFIPDRRTRKEWSLFAHTFGEEAKRRGDPKAKERSLTENMTTLNKLFLRATKLHWTSTSETNIQIRERTAVITGVLGILLFYPLRIGDLLRLRFHHELLRHQGKWLLDLNETQKTGEYVPPLVLPEEATPLIDAGLLRGYPRYNLDRFYEEADGRTLLKSPRKPTAYNPSAISKSFKGLVGHSPHAVRSIWCDDLIAKGADRMIISAMLQHKRLISQKHYEVLAKKIRRNRAVETLRRISEELQ